VAKCETRGGEPYLQAWAVLAELREYILKMLAGQFMHTSYPHPASKCGCHWAYCSYNHKHSRNHNEVFV